MRKLTLDILDAIQPEYDKFQKIEPFNARLNEYTSQFAVNNQSWEEYHSELTSVTFDWKEIKYSDVVEKKIDIKKVLPNNVGVYCFIVRPINLINDLPRFVYYVGIAGANGSERPLSERINDYFAKSKLKKRDAVMMLIFKYYRNVYINYSELPTLPSGMTLETIETSLIGYFGTHILANIDDIPIKLRPQRKAFNI